MRWEITEAINGYRVDVWPDSILKAHHKENTDTRLEALRLVMRFITQEVYKEEEILKSFH
jgi:hypothetical protein